MILMHWAVDLISRGIGYGVVASRFLLSSLQSHVLLGCSGSKLVNWIQVRLNFSGIYPLKNTAFSLVIMMPKVPAGIIPVCVVLESCL